MRIKVRQKAMKLNLKSKHLFYFFLIILFAGFILIDQAITQEPTTEESQGAVTGEFKGGTRVIISTSGPAKFEPYWLDNPTRLVIEFKTKKIISKIDDEVIVNQGVIKKITSSYFTEGETRPLKRLTFELSKKVPYRVHQEGNTILLDIQTPIEISTLPMGSMEVLAVGKADEVIIRRLEAMDAALTELTETQPSLEAPEAIALPKTGVLPTAEPAKIEPIPTEPAKTAPATIEPTRIEPIKQRRSIASILYLFGGLAVITGSGFLLWRRHSSNTAQILKRLESELQEKNRLLDQERVIRKALEEGSLQKEKECKQLKESLETLKGSLIKKELPKEELSSEENEGPATQGQKQEGV